MSHPILTDVAARMKKAIDFTLHEFSSIHTGKASPAMVEGVMVEAYGSMMRLKECAAI
ncbi:MAG: ribosome recycling factor, partial [Opitutaceae bacterium]|nr:ribosome recycling factor [Opitutaceae bacterium]